MVCAVECVEQPSKRSLKNYLGRDLHEFLVGKLDKAWAAKHGKTIEISTAELLDVDSEEEDDGDVHATVGLCNP